MQDEWAHESLAADRAATASLLESLRRDHADIVAASAGSNADDEHDPEGSTIAFERLQVSALTAHTERHLAEIDAALIRLDNGTYGVCQTCGEQIPRARLEARPATQSCVTCAS